MRIETMFDIGDKVKGVRRHSFEEFVVGQIRATTLQQGSLILIEYRSEQVIATRTKYGTWYAEKEVRER